ncbi:tRNA (adenosine(37)-N6)-threonylcarbamoyltransferase complex dimerization subunit type 1 TsaB [Lacibacterium aquatile]|uniref:tRNA (Adenosine(37)-N6)-threonylcarbamoyltransferase complex dimerization subunit type 1 TsaB n=1 Tax=Lacibacterium aquatile TaxID=1168082 RepID=A0ABW5DSR3_9PROT
MTPTTSERSKAIARPLLAVESSGGALSTAIVMPDGVVRARMDEIMMRGHAERIVAMIAETLNAADLAARDLGAVASSVGPGSFTGIRVGLAAARGVGLAAGLPVIGIGSAAAVAYGAREQAAGRPILVLIDSRRADLFVQAFDADATSLGEAVALPPEDLRGFVEGLAGDGLYVTGDAVADHIDALTLPGVELAPSGPPSAVSVAMLALAALHAPEALPAAAPVYIRPPDAAVPAFGGRLKRLVR